MQDYARENASKDDMEEYGGKLFKSTEKAAKLC